MGMDYIDAAALKRAFLAGAEGLEARKEWINELNVFPVPDGDTGTNMTMTILSAAREAAAIEEPTMDLLAKAISSGSLRGARGNSGVIYLSFSEDLPRRSPARKKLTLPVWQERFTGGRRLPTRQL